MLIRRKHLKGRLIRIIPSVANASFYLEGDSDEIAVGATSIGKPLLIEYIPLTRPYIVQLVQYEESAPIAANSFVLGDITSACVQDRTYHQPIQFYRISEQEWERGFELEIRNWVLGRNMPSIRAD